MKFFATASEFQLGTSFSISQGSKDPALNGIFYLALRLIHADGDSPASIAFHDRWLKLILDLIHFFPTSLPSLFLPFYLFLSTEHPTLK